MTIWNRPAYEAGLLLDEHEVPGSVQARRRRLDEPHVAGLTTFVREVGRREGEQVPDVDPESGGSGATVLVLLQDPSRAAAYGSRFISIHNNDATARNSYLAYRATGLDYARALHWNVVPWWVKDPNRHDAVVPRTLEKQARRSRPYLREFVSLLPDLRVVLLLGEHAQAAFHAADLDLGVEVLSAPHPSPLAWNKSASDGRKNREHTIDKFVEAKKIATG